MVFHAVCIATHDERYFSAMKTSAKKAGIDLVILGWGERYTDRMGFQISQDLFHYDTAGNCEQ